MYDKTTHIVISDDGWILETLARKVTERLPYVTYGLHPVPSALIQYYVTYGCRKARVSPIEIALFTHREEDLEAAARFNGIAREVDHSVSMSNATDKLIAALGVTSRSVIPPGVELDRYHPRLKIAVVGRTYHTGRKGEALVRAVMDVPDIEWHFTGDGWPGPALHVADADLPAFYRSMDYVLIPATNEGGPMCLLEALASGVQVIASPVGWVPEFPHIPFARGDAASLRAVLMRLRDERMRLRGAVRDMTWDRWVGEHDALFRRLAEKLSPARPIIPPLARKVRSAELLTHGIEDTTLGGPSIRVPKTAAALEQAGLSARALHYPAAAIGECDLLHGFNLWPPASAVRMARRVRMMGKPFVFSPILLDLSEGNLWQADLLRAFRAARTGEEAEALMADAREKEAERRAAGWVFNPEPGYQDTLRELSCLSNGLLFLSERERALFAAITGEEHPCSAIVRNPVDAALFAGADPKLFRSRYGLDDYVICVARIEHRKNQLMLALALRDAGILLVLVGHAADAEYLGLIRRFAGPNLLIINRLEPGSELLRSAIAGARVFVLPSWAEGAPLAALEAAAAGVSMVLSDRSSEREYFGDQATYCDPADPVSIREAVLTAYDRRWTPDDRAALSGSVAERYSWTRYAWATADMYEQVFADEGHLARGAELLGRRAAKPQHATDRRELLFDITTYANNTATRSGIVRVEQALALELLAHPGVRVRFVLWESLTKGFVEIPPDILANDLLLSYLGQLRAGGGGHQVEGIAGADLIAVGSSWMQNFAYATGLGQFAETHDLTLSVLMHDMTPALFPHWYPEGYTASWNINCATILRAAKRLLVYSESTRRDVTAFALEHDIDLAPVEKIRLADEIGSFSNKPTDTGLAIQQFLSSRPFVLSVGGIHVRKNYALLCDVWIMLRESMGEQCPHLVIAGGVSWNGGDLARAIREDRRVNRHIHIMDKIDDGALDWLYRHCLFTAYPSLYEGWGLPVGESLNYGKICISSNSSSMPEIAPGCTDLLAPVDRTRWHALVRHYAGSASARAQREASIRNLYAGTSWRSTVGEIVAALSGDAAQHSRGHYNIGRIVLASDAAEASAYLVSGWFAPESWGCWASDVAAVIRVTLTRDPEGDMVFQALVKAFGRLDETKRYSVRANGEQVADWTFQPPSPNQNDRYEYVVGKAYLPLTAIAGSRTITLELRSEALTAADVARPGTEDERLLGIGLAAFMLEDAAACTDTAVLLSMQPRLRQALAVPDDVDLTKLVTMSVVRRAITPDRWLFPTDDAVRWMFDGSIVAGRAVSVDRCARLVGGLARVSFSRDLKLEILVAAPWLPETAAATMIVLVNDRLVERCKITGPTAVSCAVTVPRAILAASDPALILLVLQPLGGESGMAAGEFELLGVRLNDRDPLPSRTACRIPIGRQVGFGSDALRVQPNIAHALDGGWYPAEETGIWSIGELGRLRFKLGGPGAGQPDMLLLRLSRRASGGRDLLRVVASGCAHGGTVAFEPIERGGMHAFGTVAVDLAPLGQDRSDGLLELGFSIGLDGTASSLPYADQRQLGVHVAAATALSLSPLEAGTELAIGKAEDGRVAWLDGWHDPEPEGRWMGERVAELALRLAPSAGGPSTLTFGLLTLPAGGTSAVPAGIVVDGQRLEAHVAINDDAMLVSVVLPFALIAATTCHIVRIEAGRLVSPLELGLNSDPRLLGWRLMSVTYASSLLPSDETVQVLPHFKSR